MQLRDVQNPGPKTYFNESGYLKSTGRCHNIAINEESATAFCVGSRNVCRGGLYIIDISVLFSLTIRNPRVLASLLAIKMTATCMILNALYIEAQIYNIGGARSFLPNEDLFRLQ